MTSWFEPILHNDPPSKSNLRSTYNSNTAQALGCFYRLYNIIFIISYILKSMQIVLIGFFMIFSVLVLCTQVNMIVCECISTPGKLEKHAWPRWESNLRTELRGQVEYVIFRN
jgi:hypothetical protein